MRALFSWLAAAACFEQADPSFQPYKCFNVYGESVGLAVAPNTTVSLYEQYQWSSESQLDVSRQVINATTVSVPPNCTENGTIAKRGVGYDSCAPAWGLRGRRSARSERRTSAGCSGGPSPLRTRWS